MKSQFMTCASLGVILWLTATETLAWGAAAHRVISGMALAALQTGPREEVRQILGVESTADLPARFTEACNWPDTVRDSPQWTWSAPQHYVNIPRYDNRYDRQRDCSDGRCLTEAIIKYAASLGQPDLDRVRRRQALGWVCHLVADLHQPLHAGFRDDRGGNQVSIVYRGQRYNLHAFWDRVLPEERVSGWQPAANAGIPADSWKPEEVVAWTEESHALALAAAYPSDPEGTEDFAAASWDIMQLQWQKAAARLARVLNTTLSEEVLRRPN